MGILPVCFIVAVMYVGARCEVCREEMSSAWETFWVVNDV